MKTVVIVANPDSDIETLETFQQMLTSAMIPFVFKNPLPHADEATASSGLFSYRPYIF